LSHPLLIGCSQHGFQVQPKTGSRWAHLNDGISIADFNRYAVGLGKPFGGLLAV